MTLVTIKNKQDARDQHFISAAGAGVRNGKLTNEHKLMLKKYVEKEAKKVKKDCRLGLWVTGQYVYIWYDCGYGSVAKKIADKALVYLKEIRA